MIDKSKNDIGEHSVQAEQKIKYQMEADEALLIHLNDVCR